MADDPTAAPAESVSLTIRDGDEERTIDVTPGRTLRAVLLERGFDVYGHVSRHANCGGRDSVGPVRSGSRTGPSRDTSTTG